MRRLAAVLLACACSSTAGQEPPPPEAPASAPARWVQARPPRDVSLLEVPAQVLPAPESRAVVAPPFDARVVRVRVAAGQRVAKGAPLVDVIMPELVSAAGAWSAASTRVAAYTRRKVKLEALAREGLTRAVELTETEAKLAEARADLKAAQATFRAAGMTPRGASALLRGDGTVPLTSPIAGVVTEVQAVVGETRPGGGAPLVRVAGDSAARIEARLTHPPPRGARFELVTSAGEAIPLRLLEQAPFVDPTDASRPAWFEPEVPQPLPGGLTARLRILPPEDTRAVVVPTDAVGGGPGDAFVIRRRGDGSERVGVRVLARSGADALVEGALVAGDEVSADPEALAGDAGTR